LPGPSELSELAPPLIAWEEWSLESPLLTGQLSCEPWCRHYTMKAVCEMGTFSDVAYSINS